jgi:large subunit ribosomal protein L18
MTMQIKKNEKRSRLKKKIRAKVKGTKELPRLSVYRSNKFIYAQIIDDEAGKTLVSASDVKTKKGAKIVRAEEVGTIVAESAKKSGITKVVFDRNGFKYTGRIKLLADSARKAGLTF